LLEVTIDVVDVEHDAVDHVGSLPPSARRLALLGVPLRAAKVRLAYPRKTMPSSAA
jgi:hypothetical protein